MSAKPGRQRTSKLFGQGTRSCEHWEGRAAFVRIREKGFLTTVTFEQRVSTVSTLNSGLATGDCTFGAARWGQTWHETGTCLNTGVSSMWRRSVRCMGNLIRRRGFRGRGTSYPYSGTMGDLAPHKSLEMEPRHLKCEFVQVCSRHQQQSQPPN